MKSNKGKAVDLIKLLTDEDIQSLQDVNTIDELNSFIGDDEITEEEYEDIVSYIQNKNREKNISKNSKDVNRES